MTLLGYSPWSAVPGIDQYPLPVIGVIVVVSLLPVAVGIARSRRAAGRGHR